MLAEAIEPGWRDSWAASHAGEVDSLVEELREEGEVQGLPGAETEIRQVFEAELRKLSEAAQRR